jgi:hypothetical protein
MSGMWKQSMVNLVRHRQTKEPETDREHLNHRATSRLYRCNPLLRRRMVAAVSEEDHRHEYSFGRH